MSTTEQPSYPTWSYSRLQTLEKCGILHKFVYDDGLRLPPKAAMIRGTGAHRSRELAMKLKLQEPDAPALTPDECAAVARDEVVLQFTGEVNTEGEDKAVLEGKTVDAAVELAVLDRMEFHDSLKPVETEERWEWQPPWLDVPIIGYADLLCEEELTDDEREHIASAGLPEPAPSGHILRDMKTGKRRAKGSEHTDEQLTVEALLYVAKYGRLPRAVGLDLLVDNREPMADRRVSLRTQESFGPLLNRFARANEIVKSGAYMPAKADAWWCSEKWCGFWNVCPFALRPVSVAVPALNKET